MKLKKGERSYWLPPTGRIVDVVLEANGHRYRMEEITPEAMKEIESEARGDIPEGLPTMFCIRVTSDEARSSTMYTWPAPESDDHRINIRFYPPMMVA